MTLCSDLAGVTVAPISFTGWVPGLFGQWCFREPQRGISGLCGEYGCTSKNSPASLLPRRLEGEGYEVSGAALGTRKNPKFGK